MKSLKSKIENFFASYTSSLERFDVKSTVSFYDFPCSIISDQGNMVFHKDSELLETFASGVVQYKKFDFAKVKTSIISVEKASDLLFQAKVKYEFSNSSDNKIYDCEYWYTLKTYQETTYKIVSVLSINETNKMLALMQKSFSNIQ